MDFREMTMDDAARYRAHVRRETHEMLHRADAAMAGTLNEYKAREAALWHSAMNQNSRVSAILANYPHRPADMPPYRFGDAAISGAAFGWI